METRENGFNCREWNIMESFVATQDLLIYAFEENLLSVAVRVCYNSDGSGKHCLEGKLLLSQ